MTLLETAEIMKTITKSYPNGNRIDDEQTVNTWAAMFAEDPKGLVEMAVIKHISANKWVPSVSEIREIIVEITRPDLIPPDEAWSVVLGWLNATSEYGGEDVHRIFPTAIADTIEACGGKSTLWALRRQRNSFSGKAGLDKLTFMQLYEPRYARDRENAILPANVREGIEQVKEQLGNAEYVKFVDMKRFISNREQEKRALEQRQFRRLIEQAGGDNADEQSGQPRDDA